MHQALKRLRFWDIRVFSVSTGTELTTRTGKLMASVLAWKDKTFLDDLIDKTRRGMLGQVRRGFSAGGRAYGYRSEPVLDEHHQVIGARRVIDPEQSAVVIRIFELYVAGYGPKTIVHILAIPRFGIEVLSLPPDFVTASQVDALSGDNVGAGRGISSLPNIGGVLEVTRSTSATPRLRE
jgi:hypothetical protein